MSDSNHVFPLHTNAERMATILALSYTRFKAGINKTEDATWVERVRRHYRFLCDSDLSPVTYPEAWKEAYEESGVATITGVSFDTAFPDAWLASFLNEWRSRPKP